jgi:lysophospholipase L1-like esterase
MHKTRSANKNKAVIFFLLLLFMGTTSFVLYKKQRPTFFIIGDSTVRNGDGSGRNGQWGWGSFMKEYFDTTKIDVQNHALGGRSSRTFITEGLWDKILVKLKKGDYVIMQFGHNDSGPLDDTARARGTIKGIGTESKEVYNPIMKKQEVVYSYGYYMRKYVRDAKAKGAIPIICSLIPRNDWQNAKIKRANDGYALWAQQIAKEEGVYFIDLHNLVSDKYDVMGTEKVAPLFHGDHTHTSLEGAKINAAIVAEQIRKIKPGKLQKYLLAKR